MVTGLGYLGPCMDPVAFLFAHVKAHTLPLKAFTGAQISFSAVAPSFCCKIHNNRCILAPTYIL